MDRKFRVIIGSTLVAIATGCASVAETSRTGDIQEVRLAERLTPADVQVESGEEIRWINERSMPVTIEFLEGALEDVSCERGFSTRTFSNVMGQRREAATIKPHGTASLCFTAAGTVSYNARMESPIAGGQVIDAGTIRVGQ
jgi:plastocyanin